MTASLRDTRSLELYDRALNYLPGGVNSPVRAMRAIGRAPIFVHRAEGAELVDVDELGALRAVDEDRVAADRAHRANG